MAPEEDSDAEDRAGEGGGDRPDSSPDPYRPGPTDSFWAGALVLIVVVLLLAVLVSHMDWSPGNPNQNMPPYK
ncbi:hypothetical protein [Kitasatospora sp. NPDC051914]|uniref:hypothetical protein n=1 Tax=Kitasatospora sp. NPDC051914 TaxID=3154945 RepID=UPI00341216BA